MSVGATLGAIAVIVGIWLIYRRQKRKRKTTDPEVLQANDGKGGDAPEVAEASDSLRRVWETSELEAKNINELPGPIAELDGAAVREEDAVVTVDSMAQVEEYGSLDTVTKGRARTLCRDFPRDKWKRFN